MCGRYFFSNSYRNNTVGTELMEILNDTYGECSVIEILPGNEAPVFIHSGNAYRVQKMKWGFTAAKGKRVINARVETLHERVMFSSLTNGSRCVVPASGYYEWRMGDRQKFSISMKDGEDIAYFAGLFRHEENGHSFTIITRCANAEASEIHNRMPLILKNREYAEKWLYGEKAELFLQEEIALDIKAEGAEQLRMLF